MSKSELMFGTTSFVKTANAFENHENHDFLYRYLITLSE